MAAGHSDTCNAFMGVIRGEDYLILDTETTGLGPTAEICQIAIINSKGETLLDTLIRPTRSIPADAQRIHGISDQMCAPYPQWPSFISQISELLDGKNLIVYNATYDRGMMHKSTEAHYMRKIEWKAIARWHCAMLAYAEAKGDWNEYRGDWRWHKLTDACRQLRLPINNAHSALGDCLMTLEICRRMAASEVL